MEWQSPQPGARFKSFREGSQQLRLIEVSDAYVDRVGFIVTNLSWRSKNVVKFYNGRGTAEQWIKEGKNAVKWNKLSCRTFKDNQTRLQLFALAYNLGNFLRRLALPKPIRHWSLTTLREKLIKLAEVAVTRNLFAAILARIARLAMPPPVVVSGMPA